MKKVLSIVLCLCIILSVTPIISFAADKNFSATIVSDIHYSVYSQQPIVKRNSVSEDFYHVNANGLMLSESNAIFNQFLENAAKDENDFLFVCGDSTNAGTVEETLTVAKRLEAFEKKTGKTVFVINGNHDMLTFGPDYFKTAYANLGYDKAIAIDPDSCSYTADLNDTYRLIAIDSCRQASNLDNLNEARLSWVEAQVKSAKADGKLLVAITHHNIMEHFQYQSSVLKSSVVSPSKQIPEKFADWGLKFVFSGHSHDNDISVHTSANSNKMYNIVTPSLSLYPTAYRTAAFSNNVTVNTINLTGINADHLPDGFSETALKLMKSDWNAYAKECFTVGISAVLNNYLRPAYFKQLLGANEDSSPDLSEAIDIAIPRIIEAIDMPLYSAEGVTALEDVAKSNGESFAITDYKTAREYILDVAAAHFAGGDLKLETQLPTISSIITSILIYALEPVGNTVFLKAIITKLFGKIPVVDGIISNLNIKNNYTIIKIATSVLMTVVVRPITIDKAPNDHNATLQGYNSGDSTENPFESIIDLVKMLSSFLQSLISFYNAITT